MIIRISANVIALFDDEAGFAELAGNPFCED
jgi:hypothetical protein